MKENNEKEKTEKKEIKKKNQVSEKIPEQKTTKTKKIIAIIVITVAFLALVGIIIFLIIQLNANTKQNSNVVNETVTEESNMSIQTEGKEENTEQSNTINEKKSKVRTVSFQQMDYNNDNLNEDQKIIAKYFDEDYLMSGSYTELVRYADMLKNMKISCYAQVNSILSSDDENFEALCQWSTSDQELWDEVTKVTEPIIIKGKKTEKMVIKGDNITLKGRLIGAETRTIDGENKYLPVIEIAEIGEDSYWYSDDTIKKVAHLVFGNNIKVRTPTDDETYKMVTDYDYSFDDYVWLAELEDQSNLNFKVFDIWQSNSEGIISYNGIYNQGLEKDLSNKRLYVTPDLQKYVVFDMSYKDKIIYISVYDRKLNKLWSREIENASQITWDSTNTNLIFVSDNDFYNINIETGENIWDPVLVGKKSKVRIVDNGYILVGEDSDDSVIFLDSDGHIKNKFDTDLNVTNADFIGIGIQEIDNNYVILYNVYDNTECSSKYIIINENGEKIKESE